MLRPSGRLVAIVASVAFLLKMAIALRTYGTNDVFAYERFLHWSRYLGVGLYRAAWDFNHPPFMLHVLRGMGWLAQTSGVAFPFWLRLPGIVADPITLWLVWKTLGPRTQDPTIRWALLMLAAAPPLILVAGFHGNTDTIMVLFLVLAVYLMERGKIGRAGAAFGLSMSFKVVPVIVVPAIFFYLGKLRHRAIFFVVAGAVLLLLWSPYIFQDPLAIGEKTFRYRSIYGHWGFSFLASHFLGPRNWINRIYRKVGAYLLLAAIAGISVWMNRRHSKPPLFSQIGLVLSLFLGLSNAFGVQYLVWLVPWTVSLGAGPTALYYTTSGAFLLLVYNYWSEGFPWYLADSNRIENYQGHLAYFHLLCWLSVVCLSALATKQVLTGKPFEPEFVRRIPAFGRRVALALSLLVLVVYPAARQWNVDSRPPARPDGDRTLVSVRAREYSELASHLYLANRPRETIIVARQALALDPNDADAHNNIAASAAALGLWDEAIQNAQQALRIRPDFPLARKNLAWALQAREKQIPR